MTHRISQLKPHTPQLDQPTDAGRSQDAGPARPASGSTKRSPASASDGYSLPAGAAKLSARHAASAATARVTTARSAVTALARELPGHGVGVDAFAARFGASHYARASNSEIHRMATYEFTRAALTHNPALADRAIAHRLRGMPAHDRQIVDLSVGRSGATGLQRYALAEHAAATTQPFSSEQRDDLLALVQTGDSVDQAAKRERAALSDIAAETKATPHAQASKPHARFDVAAQTAHWAKVYHEANAEFRRLPVLSRDAEISTGVGASIGAATALVVGAVKSAVTLDASHIERAADKAGNAGGYIAGELTEHIHQADALYMQLARQHDEFSQLSRQVSAAVKTHDYDAMPAAVERMKTLAGHMDQTSKQFFAAAHSVDKENAAFNHATVKGAAEVAMAGVGAAATAISSGGELLVELGKEIVTGAIKGEVIEHADRSVVGAEE